MVSQDQTLVNGTLGNAACILLPACKSNPVLMTYICMC